MYAMSEAATMTRRLDDVAPAGTRLVPGQFAHIVLYTQDVARLRDWYVTFLNAAIVGESPLGCFLTYDDEHHRLGIASMPGLAPRDPDVETVGVAHYAYGYRGLGELLHTYRRLKRAGIVPFWPINHGMTVSLYYRDPDGNVVEIQSDVFATAEEGKAFLAGMASDNPLGIRFDPDEMVARYEAGDAIETLARRRDLRPGEHFLEHLWDGHPARPG